MKTNYPGITTNPKSILISFYYMGKRYRETLSIPPTKHNVRHAAGFLSMIKCDIAFNNFNYANFFPNSKHAAVQSKGVTNEKQL